MRSAGRPAVVEQPGQAGDDQRSFRQRLLDALEESIAEDGYPNTTVGDVVRRARTSRRTFYEHFSSREACFVALIADAGFFVAGHHGPGGRGRQPMQLGGRCPFGAVEDRLVDL